MRTETTSGYRLRSARLRPARRLFAVRHRIFTPAETIDGAPDERLAIMENLAASSQRRRHNHGQLPD
jgi:hypothetical protein